MKHRRRSSIKETLSSLFRFQQHLKEDKHAESNDLDSDEDHHDQDKTFWPGDRAGSKSGEDRQKPRSPGCLPTDTNNVANIDVVSLFETECQQTLQNYPSVVYECACEWPFLRLSFFSSPIQSQRFVVFRKQNGIGFLSLSGQVVSTAMERSLLPSSIETTGEPIQRRKVCGSADVTWQHRAFLGIWPTMLKLFKCVSRFLIPYSCEYSICHPLLWSINDVMALCAGPFDFVQLNMKILIPSQHTNVMLYDYCSGQRIQLAFPKSVQITCHFSQDMTTSELFPQAIELSHKELLGSNADRLDISLFTIGKHFLQLKNQVSLNIVREQNKTKTGYVIRLVC